MRVFFVTSVTPTTENIRGVSAHPYYLLKYRPKDVEIMMFTFNMNSMSLDYIEQLKRDLCCDIKVVELHRYKGFRYSFLLLKGHDIRLTDEIRRHIYLYQPDIVWTYPNYFAHWAKMMPKYKFVNSEPDSLALAWIRHLKDNYYHRSFLYNIYRIFCWYRYYLTEKDNNVVNQYVHFVGKEDLYQYSKVYKADNGFYIDHPHYALMDKEINFSSNKLRVLIAGNYDIYMKTGVDDFVGALVKAPQISNYIELSFLGKGWNDIKEYLKSYDYKCDVIGWVDNYIEEIIKYDIQLSPISFGTGTKAKVLDAMCNGVLAIGTPLAMENIHYVNGESAICYQFADELPDLFEDIYNNRKKYEEIAKKGMEIGRMFHNPTLVSNSFFDKIRSLI